MTATLPATIETDFLADSFLTTTGISFDFNQREVLHSALTDFLGRYTTEIVTSTLESLARRGDPDRRPQSGVWI
jgi:hypothetical protein